MHNAYVKNMYRSIHIYCNHTAVLIFISFMENNFLQEYQLRRKYSRLRVGQKHVQRQFSRSRRGLTYFQI